MSGDKFETGESSQDTAASQTVKDHHHLLASNYAMQVAIQTMKERCHQLQCRLSIVEEENLRLRIEKQKLTSGMLTNESKNDVSSLQEQVAHLSRQKSQLTNHILMVATENKQLWTRLSKLTEANQSLGSHLSKISETLNKHPLGDSQKPHESISIVNSCEKESKASKEESLEEISLKIINSIMREKMELEQQYEQMVELQTGAVSVEDCDFTLGCESRNADMNIRGAADEGVVEVLQDVRRVVEKMKEEKELLLQQQSGLRSAVTSLSIIIKNGLCNKCQIRTGDETQGHAVVAETKPAVTTSLSGNQNILEDIQHQLQQVSEPPPLDAEDDNHKLLNMTKQEGHSTTTTMEEFAEFEDRICPLCEKFYHRTAKFEEFHRHVLTHFSNEDNEYDSLINNYEVIT